MTEMVQVANPKTEDVVSMPISIARRWTVPLTRILI
jgi:hypothetical protein